LVIRLSLYSSSSSECAQGKAYNVKIQFVHIIIQNIDTIRTFAVEFLRTRRQHWHARE
jgi:hypothetical protein